MGSANVTVLTFIIVVTAIAMMIFLDRLEDPGDVPLAGDRLRVGPHGGGIRDLALVEDVARLAVVESHDDRAAESPTKSAGARRMPL